MRKKNQKETSMLQRIQLYLEHCLYYFVVLV